MLDPRTITISRDTTRQIVFALGLAAAHDSDDAKKADKWMRVTIEFIKAVAAAEGKT